MLNAKIGTLTFERLHAAVADSGAAVRIVTRLGPAGGDGDKVFPPTYKHSDRDDLSTYAFETRRIDGREVKTVLLDSAASQANRMEESLLRAFDQAECDLPVLSVVVQRPGAAPTRVTALDAPHRVSDAIFRDCLYDGKRFRESALGKPITAARPENATALFRFCPTALVFGFWDSQSGAGVHGARVPRAVVSEIIGLDAVSGRRTSSRVDPLAISASAAKIYKSDQDMWTLDEKEAAKEKGKPQLFGKAGKAGKPSAINHGNVTPSVSGENEPGGVTIAEAVQTTVLSLPQLRRLRFPVPETGESTPERDAAGRTVLAALALYAAALQREDGYFLRSRCHLVPLKTPRCELVGPTSLEVEPFSLTAHEARAVFGEACERARKLGLSWKGGLIELQPSDKLVELVRRSDEKVRAEGGKKMLALEVEFLLGRYAAADFRDRERPEWPPHPARLFSALVAAAHDSGIGESARAALLWLESLPPPQVSADEAPGVQSPVTAYVPVNDPEDDLLPQRAERQPRAFPSVVPQSPPVVHFVWPDAQPDELLRRLLGVVAENVAYLGSSRSPIRVRLTDHPPAPNWVPDDAGDAVLRVPNQGRLESLAWHFENGLRPPVGAFQRYRSGPGKAEEASPESSFGEMVVFRLAGPVDMEIETTLRLTEVLRAAAMRRAQDELGEVPEVLSGHDSDGRPVRRSHAAYAALPFVSEQKVHADGRVMGLAVILPRDIAPTERRRTVRALMGLDHLTVAGVGRLMLERLTPDRAASRNLRPETWAAPSRRWASVTPVVFDRFPKRGGRGVEAIVARGCCNIGLPERVDVAVDHFSRLYGVEPSFRFVVRRGGPGGQSGGSRLYTHVTLAFERPVRGPLLLGAARHFGLGLMRPLVEDET